MLGPDKVALAVLYYLYSSPDPSGDPVEIAAAIGAGFTPSVTSAALEKLNSLGLVIPSGALPMIIGEQSIAGTEWWSLTHEGHALAFRMISKHRSFMARLHSEGFAWLTKPAATVAKLSLPLDSHGVATVLAERPVERNWSRQAAIAAWIIIPVTIVGICVAIWLDFN